MSEDTRPAYDLKDLVEKLKERGLDVAEDAAKALVESVLDWVADSAIKSENKVDDLLAGFIPVIKPAIMEAIDKIDGKVG